MATKSRAILEGFPSLPLKKKSPKKWAVQHLQKKDPSVVQPLQLYELLSYLKLPMVIWVWNKNAIVFGCWTNPVKKYVQVKLDHLPQNIRGENNKSFKPPLRRSKWSILFREQPLIFSSSWPPLHLTLQHLDEKHAKDHCFGCFGVRQVNRITFGPFGPWIKWRHWA